MTKTRSLRSGHKSVSALKEDRPDPHAPVSQTLESYYQKNSELRGIPAHIIRKAWFTTSHLLLEPGATVIDMGCAPAMTYAMACLTPQTRYIGIDPRKKIITAAQKNYIAPNLEFRAGDFNGSKGFEAESIDAIINSYILHEVFSDTRYSERAVINTLESQFRLLKPEGMMFIRDYAMPPQDEYVLLEMPDIQSKSLAIEDLSEADLLVWFSENARPRGPKGCTGFFLEELPQRVPRTRLFRLPYRWAYEYIMRKDDRENWQQELGKQYTFFTPREYRKHLRGMSARVLYSSPQWDDAYIAENFTGHFRLYNDEGKLQSMPATSFIAVAQKMGEKQSLRLQERRPSNTADSQITITAMRNEVSGQVFDVISRDMDITEIMPYRLTPEGALNVFIHEGLPRGITNAVPRTGKQLDGKRWSGHMTEAIAVPTQAIFEVDSGEPKQVVLFARDYLGLKPAAGSKLEIGPSFFPAPDYIDEQIKTRYLLVTEHNGTIEPKNVGDDIIGFTTKGRIREVSAQGLLNAINVGYIPNSRLETQLLELFDMLGIKAETWHECPLKLDAGVPQNNLDTRKFMSLRAAPDKRFKKLKGTTGTLRPVRSIFVDEGWVEGGIEGLASRDIEFVITDEQTVNKAIILPLTKHSISGQVMAGVVTEYLPVPERHKGNGLTVQAPSITLPKDITSIDEAKKFIAAQFDVEPSKVARLGESYFCHIGLTPTRIFPFCVATTGKRAGPLGGPVQYAPLIGLVNMIWACEDFYQARFILSRYQKVWRFEAHNSEVTGEWSLSAEKLYQQTMQRAPEIANSRNAVGLSVSGWSTEKSKQSIEEARTKAESTYVSSPDFMDIHVTPDKDTEAQREQEAQNKHNAEAAARNKREKRSDG